MRPVVVGHYDHSRCCGRYFPVEVVMPVAVGDDWYWPIHPRCSVTDIDLWQTRPPTREMRNP